MECLLPQLGRGKNSAGGERVRPGKRGSSGGSCGEAERRIMKESCTATMYAIQVSCPSRNRTISDGQDRVRLMSADSRLRYSAILLLPSSNSVRRILLSDSVPGNTLRSFISPRQILRIPSYYKTEVVEDKRLCLGHEEDGQGGTTNGRGLVLGRFDIRPLDRRP